MIDVFVISLASDGARRRKMREHLERLGIEPIFFNAVDGRDGIPEDLKQLVDYDGLGNLWRRVTDTEIACALSHALLQQKIATETRRPAVILEDDAIVGADFAALARSGAMEKSGHEHVLLFHHRTRVMRFTGRRLFRKFKTFRLFRNPLGAVAYFVSVEGARKLSEKALPIRDFADWPFDLVEMGSVVLVPRIIGHPEKSTEQSNMKEREKMTAEYVAKVQAMKKAKRSIFAKLSDPKYRAYFFRKIRSRWVYRAREF